MSDILNNRIVTVNDTVLGAKIDVNLNDFDVVTVSSVAFSDIGTSDNIFLIWCSETNNYVSSFLTVNAKADLLPNIDIRLNKSNPTIEFKLFEYGAPGSQPIACTTGILSITLNFKKFKPTK